MKYAFEYQPDSTYEHVVTLLGRNARSGLVVDLGCGFAQIAAPLRELGFDYLGADLDPATLASLSDRGLENATIDLRDLERLADQIAAAVAGRKVAAVTMLDVLEHLVDPRAALAAIRAGMERIDTTLLVLSVPNVAHHDLAAQLLMGRWDVTDTGLLDRTHVSLFTGARLDADLAACGFRTVDRFDTIAPETEQHVPADAPALALSSTLSRALRAWRSSADEFGDTYQFVAVHELTPRVEEQPHDVDPAPADGDRVFATVVVRTMGTRSSLEDALVSLAAQTDDEFEVLLVVNSADTSATDRVSEMVNWFAPAFRDRVRIVQCTTTARSAPLNLALDLARGRYLTFLDDDDVVLAHWIETFRVGLEFPGRIVRSICYGQDFVDEPGSSDVHYAPVAAPVSFGRSFDFIEHLVVNKTPFCSIALPVDALRSSGIRFDPQLDVIEDFDVLIRLAQLCGVIDTEVPTSLYRRWRRTGAPTEITHERWAASLDVVLAKLDRNPLLLPSGSATRVRKLEYDFHRLAGEVHALRGYVAELEGQAATLGHRVDAYERSRFWKLTKPLRAAARRAHSLRTRWHNR